MGSSNSQHTAETTSVIKSQKLSAAEFRVYNSLAERMDKFLTSTTISGSQAALAPDIRKYRQDRKLSKLAQMNLIESALSFCTQIQMHHGFEETHIYPILSKCMPQFRKEVHLNAKHEEIDVGIQAVQNYLMQCRPGDLLFDAQKLKMMMDGFQETLFSHLDDEVQALGADNMYELGL
ncbi:uncharacterized protein N7477_006266 [Penicillium maclennaniae]|uniref:uncharacterized protein n=1 Tax=Penicillium maclennaniae TaxID=1343394 RepID=UPI0025407B42|nr:uncharacterized protein N7477_006266 [Penicillium maclennaniae]KAJ5667696.1 hypothetical protein N7477_006266 [Penicillium maclennaniae]